MYKLESANKNYTLLWKFPSAITEIFKTVPLFYAAWFMIPFKFTFTSCLRVSVQKSVREWMEYIMLLSLKATASFHHVQERQFSGVYWMVGLWIIDSQRLWFSDVRIYIS